MAEKQAAFDFIRYAQCWEDADVLLEALDVRPGGQYLSIASGGENSFSMLSRGARVTAVDLSLPQLAVTDLKKATYAALEYEAFLAFVGVRDGAPRLETYERIKDRMLPDTRAWTDAHPEVIERGVIHTGKFESYFSLFRRRVLPLVHGSRTRERLCAGHPDRAERERYYDGKWDNLRYRALFRLFFSRRVMGKRGRDAAFFNHVEGRVSSRIKKRVRIGLIETDPAENPYFHYIMTGGYGDALPHALRRESFERIKANIDCLTLLQIPAGDAAALMTGRIDGCNLSDIFEYMSPEQMAETYRMLLDKAAPGARFVYWNMLAPRDAAAAGLETRVAAREELAGRLFTQDKAFFYSRLIIEEVL